LGKLSAERCDEVDVDVFIEAIACSDQVKDFTEFILGHDDANSPATVEPSAFNGV